MADDTAFYAFKERIQQELFRNNFCFSMVTGLWVKLFLIFGRFFPGGSTCPGEGSEVKMIFFQKIYGTFSFGFWAENFVLFVPINSLKNCHKCLVPLQTNTFNEVIFSGKFSILWFFFAFWAGKFRQVCQKIVYVDRKKLRKMVFTSNDLILDIVFSPWTNLLGFWPKIFNRDVNFAISGSRWSTSWETSFIRINYQFQFS